MLHLPSALSFQDDPFVALFEERSIRGIFTVLLAEDDDDLRCVMEATLMAMGYLVVACADAELALLAFHSHRHINALLTDFQMPGKSGIELARELTSACPTLPVMVITGSVLSTESMKEIAKRGWVFVSKPCNLSSLQTTLDRMLISTPNAA